MKHLLKITIILLTSLVTVLASAGDQEQDSFERIGADTSLLEFANFSNPPGSKWISVRCGRNSTCYPPQGYKFRHFNTDIKGSGCKGSQKRRVKQNKDFIKTSRKCSVIGRVFVWPAEYCKGNYKYCS